MWSVARGKTCAGEDVDQGLIGVEGGFIGIRDLGRCLVLEACLHEHPVLATVEIVLAQVTDVGDVLDVQDLDAVVQEHASDEVREQVRAELPT
jgi:hypothetical protein